MGRTLLVFRNRRTTPTYQKSFTRRRIRVRQTNNTRTFNRQMMGIITGIQSNIISSRTRRFILYTNQDRQERRRRRRHRTVSIRNTAPKSFTSYTFIKPRTPSGGTFSTAGYRSLWLTVPAGSSRYIKGSIYLDNISITTLCEPIVHPSGPHVDSRSPPPVKSKCG